MVMRIDGVEYCNVAGVADLTGVKEATIRKWCRAGDFARVDVPVKKVMNQWWVSVPALTDWLHGL